LTSTKRVMKRQTPPLADASELARAGDGATNFDPLTGTP
jgi:hypothetical protein